MCGGPASSLSVMCRRSGLISRETVRASLTEVDDHCVLESDLCQFGVPARLQHWGAGGQQLLNVAGIARDQVAKGVMPDALIAGGRGSLGFGEGSPLD